MTRSYDVVDADGHILEPPTFWAEFIDPAFRARAPEIVLEGGRSVLKIDGREVPASDPHRIARAGGIGMREGGSPPATYEDGRRGGFDPHARIEDLDLDGIDAAFLYPTIAMVVLGQVENDPEFTIALCRAYNRWLAEYCAPYSDRLFGVALLPMQSVEAAMEEARFAREELGFRAAFVRPNPYNGRLLNDPAYDPFWQRIQDLDLAVGVHEGTGTGGVPAPGIDWVEGPSARHLVTHTVEMMLAALNLIWGGVCDRFPGVRFGFLESGGGWMVGWLDRMDRHFDDRGMRGDGPPMRPSEYFQRQCWISFEPVEESLPMAAQYLGPEKVLWATDYPHRDGFFPGAPKMIADKLPDAIKSAVLAGGATGFYRL